MGKSKMPQSAGQLGVWWAVNVDLRSAVCKLVLAVNYAALHLLLSPVAVIV